MNLCAQLCIFENTFVFVMFLAILPLSIPHTVPSFVLSYLWWAHFLPPSSHAKHKFIIYSCVRSRYRSMQSYSERATQTHRYVYCIRKRIHKSCEANATALLVEWHKWTKLVAMAKKKHGEKRKRLRKAESKWNALVNETDWRQETKKEKWKKMWMKWNSMELRQREIHFFALLIISFSFEYDFENVCLFGCVWVCEKESLQMDRKRIYRCNEKFLYSLSISPLFPACAPHTHTCSLLCSLTANRKLWEEQVSEGKRRIKRRRRSERGRRNKKKYKKAYGTTNSWKNNTENNAIELEFIFLLSFNSLFRTS